jgi:hypothetical protein
MRWWLGGIAAVAVLAAAVTIWVEWPAPPQRETLHPGTGAAGGKRALVLYHPSRDAGFSDALSLAVAEGIAATGMAVDRATMTDALPADAGAAALVVVVSNTFWFQPDWPTSRYLARAKWPGQPALGLIGGGGSTARAARLMRDRLAATGAEVIEVQQYWRARPNDETRMDEDNVAVAMQMARTLGETTARAIVERAP